VLNLDSSTQYTWTQSNQTFYPPPISLGLLTPSEGRRHMPPLQSYLYSGEDSIFHQLAYYFFAHLWSLLDMWNFEDRISEPLPCSVIFFNSILPMQIVNLIRCSALRKLLVCKMDRSAEQLPSTVCARQVAACAHTIRLFLDFLYNISKSVMLWNCVTLKNRVFVSCVSIIYSL
jgi:hypothetical protein